MAIARADRFRMKTQLVEELSHPRWTHEKIVLLLHEFDLDPVAYGSTGSSLVEAVSGLPDSELIEMYALVLEIDVDEVESAV